MLYGRFAITMPYHKKVNAVAMLHQIPALDEIPLYMYNYYSNNYYSIFMNSEEKK